MAEPRIPRPEETSITPPEGAVDGGVRTLFPQVYEQLRGLAADLIRGEASRRHLQATALVHEAFVRLSEGERRFASEQEFLAIAAAQMRHVLVDAARRARAAKRGRGEEPITFDSRILGAPSGPAIDLIELDEALSRLAALDPRQARLIEMHVFGGMPIEQAATCLEISVRTAFGDWRAARAWLLKELRP